MSSVAAASAQVDNGTVTVANSTAVPTTSDAATLDGGVFLLLAATALLCFVFAFRYSTSLILLTVVILFILSAAMFAQYDVTLAETTVADSGITVTTHCVICGNHSFAGWTLFALAILASLIFFRLAISREHK